MSDTKTKVLATRADAPDTEANMVTVIERLAARPEVDVQKLEKIIELHERILRVNAETAFNAAFTEMSPDIPTIGELARGDKSITYAPLEDIIDVVRPILARFGFALSFSTEWPNETRLKVIGSLTHERGHSRRSEFCAQADQTGSKNAIQALGSTVAYGRRYTTTDLLCIVTRREDDDGRSVPKTAGKALTTFEQLPEAVRDAIEKAFGVMKFAAGARLAKINEHFGGDGIDPESAATSLLDWLRGEYAVRTTGQPRAKKGNEKTAAAPKPVEEKLEQLPEPKEPESVPVPTPPEVEQTPAPAQTDEALF